MNLSRREINKAVAGGTIGLPNLNERPRNSEPTPWQTVQGDPAHTGYCLGQFKAIDGDVVWNVNVGEEIRAAPVVADGAAIIATTDGQVSAFDFEDGTERWKREGSAEILQAPTVDAETVYVYLTEGSVYALDIRTGETRWQTDLDPSPLEVNGSVLVDNILYLNAGVIYAIDAVTGKVRWQGNPEPGNTTGLAVSGGRVFLAGTAMAEALRAEDGSRVWLTEYGARVWGPPTIGNDVYLPLGPPNKIAAFSKDTGEHRWTFSVTDEPTDTIAAAPIVTDETIIAADRDGVVAAASKADGRVRWRYSVDGQLTHHPVACKETVYLPTDGEIISLSTASGEEQWRTQVGEIPTSPALASDRLLVTTRDGHLVALGAESGFLDRWGLELGLGTGLIGLGGYAASRALRGRNTGANE